MRWPKNPVSASLQRLSALAGPMQTVRLSAPVEPVGAMLLAFQWPMGGRSPDPDGARAIGLNVTIESWDRPADTTLTIPVADVATADHWMYETAWALGAGYLYRWMHAPRIHTWQDEAAIPTAALNGLRQNWGLGSFEIMGDALTEGAALPEMMLEAARHGYWSWECNVGYRVAEWRHDAGTGWREEWTDARDPHEEDGSRRSSPPDRSTWEPSHVAEIAAEFERLTEPEAAMLQIACDLVNRRYGNES